MRYNTTTYTPMNPVVECPACKHKFSPNQESYRQMEEKIRKEADKTREHEREEDRKKMLAWQEEQKKKLLSESEIQLKSLKEENDRIDEELKKSRQAELEFLQKEKLLKEKMENVELEIARKMKEEGEKLKDEVERKMLGENRLKDAETNKKMSDLLKQIEELKQKANQGSQQTQGEVLELELENMLKAEFPTDEIVPVGKGINGADIVQKVFDKNGRHTGTIVWESKRTKSWDKSWTQKLKADLLNSKGDVGVLVSIVLPEDIKNFGFKDGIYVTSFECFLAVAFMLRKSIIDHHSVKFSVVGKNEKMEMVYNYFLSSEFQQRVSAIAEAFTAMKSDLDTEKRVFAKLWAKREKEIEKVILNTSSLHGELHGLIGEQLPKVKALETETLLLGIEEN